VVTIPCPPPVATREQTGSDMLILVAWEELVLDPATLDVVLDLCERLLGIGHRRVAKIRYLSLWACKALRISTISGNLKRWKKNPISKAHAVSAKL
jgi:hypothetical protein